MKQFNHLTMKQWSIRAFTLIELLISIAIISLLIIAVLPNFVGFRQRARDSRRKSDLVQIQQVLEIYKMDQNPIAYPTLGAFPATICNSCWSQSGACTGNVYLRKFPCDPASIGPNPYIYAPDATDSLKYTLIACLENVADSSRDEVTAAPCQSQGQVSYTIHEP